MKILCIGDPHFKITNLPECDILISSILKLIEDTIPDLVVIMGDILDTHERLHTICLNKAVKFIRKISKHTKVYVLVGNHDMISHQEFLSENHWMYVLKGISENIVIVDKPYSTSFWYEYDNYVIKTILCPYVAPGRFIEALKMGKLKGTNHEQDIDNINIIQNIDDINIIFAHQEFFNCKFGAINSTVGDKWNKDYCMVISGHIHNRDLLQENIYYTGSPMQHAFGESYKKSICLLHINESRVHSSYENLIEDLDIILNREDTYINSFYNNYKGKLCDDRIDIIEIELKLPRKHILYREISDLNDMNDKLIKAKNDQGKIDKIWRGILKGKKDYAINIDEDKVRITITGNITEFKAFKKTKLYKELIQKGIKIQFKYNVDINMNTNIEMKDDTCCTSHTSKKDDKKYKFLDILDANINTKNDEELTNVYKATFGCAT